jgi:hypothetical protein
MEFSSLRGLLDFFLGKVSRLMRDAEREDGCARWTWNSGGNGGCRRKIPGRKLVGKDPGVVWLDGTGTEGSTIGLDDDDGSVFPCMHHLAARCKGSEADELDCRFWNIMDQSAEAGGTYMSNVKG